MKRILIVEDDRIILETTAEYLQQEGYEILKATDGEMGISMATGQLPDLILCDIHMPKFDGYQVFNKLQAQPSTCQIPFIFLTARAERNDIRFGMQLGADDYITKPIDFHELTRSIKVRLEKYERTIRSSELYYRTLFELATDAILLIQPPSGNLIDANLACINLLGYQKNELLQQQIGNIFCSSTGNIQHEEIMQLLQEGILRNHEYTWRTKAGNCLPVMLNSKHILLADSSFIMVIAHDITELKEKEAELVRSQERYREIVDLTNDWIFEINPQWQYTYVSPKVTEILGYEPSEMIGKTPFDFMAPQETLKFKEYLRGYVHDFKPITKIETWVSHKSGRQVCLETSATPVFDSRNVYTGYRGADRDITIRKQVEQQIILAKEKAEESDRLKSSILANLSHELRTPLNGILGFAEILTTELKETEYLPMVENIHISGYRLMTTLNSLITLSQLEAGKMTPATREANLKEIVNQTVRGMDMLVAEKDLDIITREIPDIPVSVDDHLLKQLLRQLLDNAIKFTEKGSISFQAHAQQDSEGEWLVLSVIDTGIGIEKSYFDLIFQEFRQVSEGFGRKYQGSGIGLTICKKIIDLLNGKITVSSKPGKGSTFSVWVPQKGITGMVFNNGQDAENRYDEQETVEEKFPLVLLVEDNSVNRDLTAWFLKDVCTLDYASDGATAIDMAIKNQYDAILMDINLGAGITGIEATKMIRQLPGYETIPIVAVTGYTMVDDQEQLIREGCTHFIAKPFDKSTLLDLIKNILNKR